MIKNIGNKLEVFEQALDLGLIHQRMDGTFRINPYLNLPKSLKFEDVSILQNMNVVSSRSEVDIKTEVVRGCHIGLPFISSNMSSVTDGNFCRLINNLGGLGILHRAFKSTEDYLSELKLVTDSTSPHGLIAVSVGIGDSQVELAKDLILAGANLITIDVAHGFSEAVKDTARKIKEYCPSVKIIVGNTNNVDALQFYDKVADAVKLGLSNGSGCETKFSAGASENQFTTVLKFKDIAKSLGMPTISDGGIKLPSDAVKGIAAGASSVMMGGVLSRCPESAAEIVDGKKIYYGMASRKSQEHWHGKVKNDCPEGKTVALEVGEPLESLLKRYAGALRSGITYAGAKDIKGLQDKVKFIRV